MSGLLEKWSSQLGIPIEKLQTKLQEYKQNLKQLYPNKPEEWINARAMGVLGAQLSPLLRSPAKPWKALIIGYSPTRDLNTRIRETALQMYREDPEKAVIEGYVKVEAGQPIPLDWRRELGGKPNPMYGKPLQPAFARTVVGLCQPWNGGDVKLFYMLDRHQCTHGLDLPGWYMFRANLRSEDRLKRVLTSSVVTKYTEIKPFIEGDVVSILQKAPSELKCTPINLEEWHANHSGDPTRVVIVEGDVLANRTQPLPSGMKLMYLGDVVVDAEFRGVPTYVPMHCEVYPPGSRVIVVGQTGLLRDPSTGERTRVSLFAFGVYSVFTPSEDLLEVVL